MEEGEKAVKKNIKADSQTPHISSGRNFSGAHVYFGSIIDRDFVWPLVNHILVMDFAEPDQLDF